MKSLKNGTFYKGSTENLLQRLAAHNAGESQFTSAKTPWSLVYVEELPTKREMLIREQNLKRGNAGYFNILIAGGKNIANRFNLAIDF